MLAEELAEHAELGLAGAAAPPGQADRAMARLGQRIGLDVSTLEQG